MLKIGEFSKLVQIPVPTLRYYDQVGLLRPAEVDSQTGYRYYSVSQLPRLHRLLALKGLGFSLESIGLILDEGVTPEQMRGMLRLRHAQIVQQLSEAQDQLREVEQRLQHIEREDQVPAYDVILKQVEPQLVAEVRAILPNYSASGALFAEAYEALRPHVLEALGPDPVKSEETMVLWYDTEFKERDIDGAAAFMVRRRVPERGRMRIHELPAATMATTVHHGSYDTLFEAHAAVIKWIEANGYQLDVPTREINLYNKMPIRRDDPSYITEIQYPVVRAENGHDHP